MKIKEKKELHNKTSGELKSLLLEVRKTLQMAKIEKARNKLKDTRLIFRKRKELACILTILKEKENIKK